MSIFDKEMFVYLLASQKNGSLYIGVTNNLVRRVNEHKEDYHPNSHSSKYNIKRLVYYESFDTAETAIAREKFLKKQKRAYKIKLIEKDNPT